MVVIKLRLLLVTDIRSELELVMSVLVRSAVVGKFLKHEQRHNIMLVFK